MTDPRHDAARDLIRRAHDDEPTFVEFDPAAGLEDLLERARSSAGLHRVAEEGDLRRQDSDGQPLPLMRQPVAEINTVADLLLAAQEPLGFEAVAQEPTFAGVAAHAGSERGHGRPERGARSSVQVLANSHPGRRTMDDRLHCDGVLVRHFRETGLSGPRWDQFQRQLLGHGLTIVTKLVRSGAVFARCGQHGRYLRKQDISPQDAEALASDAVYEGFLYFRDRGLLGREWSAEFGQSLSEYFVNACVLAFPNVYRRWQTRVNGWQDVQLVDTLASLNHLVTERTPEDVVIEQLAANAAFAELSEDRRRLLFLHDQGYSHAEIGELVRLTPRAVEGRIRRARLAVRRRPEEDR